MSIKAIVDEVPEGMADHYTKREDGKFQLAIEAPEGWALEDVSGLKSAFSKEMENRKALERKVKAFGDLDPDHAREAVAKWNEFKDIDPKKDADRIAQEKFEALQGQLGKKHQAEIQAREESNKKLRGQLEHLMVDAAATAALAEAGGSVDLLLPIIRSQTKVTEDDDGSLTVQVLGQDGSPRITSKAGDSGMMTINELVQELRQSEKYGRAFDASGRSGSGMRPGGSGGEPGAYKRSKMTAQQKAEYQRKHGQAAYLALPK